MKEREENFTTNVTIDYCFNEFLKMADFLQETLIVDKKKFLDFVLLIFSEKIKESHNKELIAKESYPFPLCSAYVCYSLEEDLKNLEDEHFVSLIEFWDKYRIGSANGIGRLLKEDKKFAESCAKRDSKNRWFLQPQKAIEYLSKSHKNPKLRKEALTYLRQCERGGACGC